MLARIALLNPCIRARIRVVLFVLTSQFTLFTGVQRPLTIRIIPSKIPPIQKTGSERRKQLIQGRPLAQRNPMTMPPLRSSGSFLMRKATRAP